MPKAKRIRNLEPNTAVYRGLDFSNITDKKFDMIVRKLGKSRSKTLNEMILRAEK